MGLEMLDAPVSGGTVRAAEGSLSIMTSGHPAAYERCNPLLDAMAANVYRLGDECGQGSTMKMINQLLAGTHLVVAAEAMAFAAKAGMDLETVYKVICNSAGGSWMFQNRVPHILADDYTPHSAIDIWIKDLGIVLETGKAEHFPLPLTAAAYQLYVAASAQGWGRLDDAGVVKVYEMLAHMQIHEGRNKD
jgi:3-hydroxyisobutyrate dehydrogenase